MTAALWHGTLTAHRYTIACPGCGSPNATTDCDHLGRTVVYCSCSPGGPFPMPLEIGGRGRDWPIDLADVGIGPVAADGPMCATPGCRFRVGARAKHCAKCCAGIAEARYPCPDCTTGTRSFKAERCKACARTRHFVRCAEQARAKRKAARELKAQMRADALRGE